MATISEINIGTTYYLELLLVDKNGSAISGEIVTYEIFRSSDNVSLTSGTLIDLGNGIYKSSYHFSALGQYRILYITPNKYTDEIESIMVVDENVSSISEKINRILGLSMENFRVIEPVYNKNNDLTDGIIKIYANATDLENDENPIGVYDVKTLYKNASKQRLVNEYTCKRIA